MATSHQRTTKFCSRNDHPTLLVFSYSYAGALISSSFTYPCSRIDLHCFGAFDDITVSAVRGQDSRTFKGGERIDAREYDCIDLEDYD